VSKIHLDGVKVWVVGGVGRPICFEVVYDLESIIDCRLTKRSSAVAEYIACDRLFDGVTAGFTNCITNLR
jgi:hypothetical protein